MRWPLVTRARMEREKVRARRRLIELLRRHPNSLVLLDGCVVRDCEISTPIIVVGDTNVVTHCLFRGVPALVEVPQ